MFKNFVRNSFLNTEFFEQTKNCLLKKNLLNYFFVQKFLEQKFFCSKNCLFKKFLNKHFLFKKLLVQKILLTKKFFNNFFFEQTNQIFQKWIFRNEQFGFIHSKNWIFLNEQFFEKKQKICLLKKCF